MNKETYLVEELDPLNEPPTFLSSFGMFGDTLCRFSDHVPKVKVQTAYASGADLGFSYIFNGQYTVSQQYFDTVFSMTADNRLMPVYVLDFGEKRADKRTGLVGIKPENCFFINGEKVISLFIWFIPKSRRPQYTKKRRSKIFLCFL